MNNVIIDTLLTLWKSGRKTRISTGGWTAGNAVCCHHRGESADRRGRGGIKVSDTGGITYSCFNCTYTASYVPGRNLNYKFRKLLTWVGADTGDIERLAIEALRVKEITRFTGVTLAPIVLPEFPTVALPDGSHSVLSAIIAHETSTTFPKHLCDAVEYIDSRSGNYDRYEFYLTSVSHRKMGRRVVIPFYWKGDIVGYTARAIDSLVTPKYYTSSPPNYVFNMDNQSPDGQFVVVSEGPFDAMSINGVSVMGNGVTDTQADIIDSLEREVIVVADEDMAGKALIKHALELGWSVSFPIWRHSVKDINEAVVRYGQLFTLKAILAGKESNPLKIKLRARGLGFI